MAVVLGLISVFSAYLYLFSTFVWSSLGASTLSANQALAENQTLTSQTQVFELGFFSPGKSLNKFLGIWYRATPDIVVWVANRNNPVIDSEGALTLAENGTLIVKTVKGTLIWSSNVSSFSPNPVLKLLDTGNLVIANESLQTPYLWQSFDYLGDTRLPEMQMVHSNLDPGLDKYLTSWKIDDDPSDGDFVYRIDNHGLPQMTIFMGTKKRYRSGPWNGYYFTGLPFFSAPAFTTKIFFSKDAVISISEPYNSSLITRFVMNYTGYAQRYVMNEQKGSWDLVFYAPNDPCDYYGQCGPNAVCKVYKIPTCECLMGFNPKSEMEWSILLWGGGCTRPVPQDCQNEDGFWRFERIKFPDPLDYVMHVSMGPKECRNECLKNCNCTAYADPYTNNGSSGCLMWFGDLIDIRELTGDITSPPSINIRVPASILGNTSVWNREKRKRPKKVVIPVIASSLGLLFLGLLLGCMFLRMRFKRQALKRKREAELELPLFNLATIASATKNFSWDHVIGEGGFGPVYKGSLLSGQVVAVKRMSRTSGQGQEEFRNEVILIAKLQHRNLVKILGCCIEGEERMLIYEYMENKSLDYFIFDQNKKALLSWPKRFDIIMGIVRGLLYLHHDSRLKVIHRDLKTSNILLDGKLDAKISDFGLARMFEGDQTTGRTKRVVGTYGYMAPEYAFDGKYSISSDVFSLGVVILEIVSGKKKPRLLPC